MVQHYVSYENLKQFYNLLMKQLKEPHLVAINICPQCGGVISEIDKCEYCGAKLKLVVEK